MHYKIQQNIYSDHRIWKEPDFSEKRVSFMKGIPISSEMDTPLEFSGDFTNGHPPSSFEGLTVPVWPKLLVEVLNNAGVNNLELFDTVIRNDKGEEWSDYYAVNVVGAIPAAHLSKSGYTKIMKTAGGGLFAGFHKLVLDTDKIQEKSLFRLAENLSEIIVHERIIKMLEEHKPGRGWGISAFKIEESE